MVVFIQELSPENLAGDLSQVWWSSIVGSF